MKTLAVLLVAMIGGCLSGCLAPQDVRKLMGFTEPGIKIVKDGENWTFTGSADFKGKGKVATNADGSYTFDVKMDSDASDVTLAQGQRADIANLLAIREQESARIIQTQGQFLGAIVDTLKAVLVFAAIPKPEAPKPPATEPTIPAVMLDLLRPTVGPGP